MMSNKKIVIIYNGILVLLLKYYQVKLSFILRIMMGLEIRLINYIWNKNKIKIKKCNGKIMLFIQEIIYKLNKELIQ